MISSPSRQQTTGRRTQPRRNRGTRFDPPSGTAALENNTIGARNTAVGSQALRTSTGNQNVAIGFGAGSVLTSGNTNIYLGHPGAARESKTMRLGSVQTKTFIAGVTTTAVTGTNVVINASRQLGVSALLGPLQAGHRDDGSTQRGRAEAAAGDVRVQQDEQGVRQYGLIAEEVAAVYPELVTRTATGEVQGVRYQELIPMLINEVQRQQQVIEHLERQQHVTEHLQRELAELRSLVEQMRGGGAQR